MPVELPRRIDHDELMKLIKDDIDTYFDGKQSHYAAALGLSQPFINLILNGHKPIPNSLARHYGYVKRPAYYRKHERD